MSFKRHPSTALILSVLNGTAPVAEREPVLDHFASCVRCQAVSESQRFILQGLSDFNESSQKKQSREGARVLTFPEIGKSKTVVLRAALGTIAATILVLTFAWPRHIQTVSAAELLSRVEAAQVSTNTEKHFYSLHMGGTTCHTIDSRWSLPVGSRRSPCACVRGQIQQSNWNDREILSARSYRQWHDGLSNHRDSVLHQTAYWTIKTDTDQGALRSASLRVRESDYRPVELTLEFVAFDPISVVEDESASYRMDMAASDLDKSVKGNSLQRVDDPATDAIEIQAWNLLRTLGADSGWEATIVRSGNKVRVAGFVSDAARRDKLTDAFSNMHEVKVELNRPLLLPRRDGNGDSKPLAEHSLEVSIPDAHDRGERITEITDASKAVVGKAFFCDRLMARRLDLEASSSAHALDPLIQSERADLLAATARLSDMVNPLITVPTKHKSQTPLSYAQARELDVAILALFDAAPKQSASLLETTNRVRMLLTKN